MLVQLAGPVTSTVPIISFLRSICNTADQRFDNQKRARFSGFCPVRRTSSEKKSVSRIVSAIRSLDSCFIAVASTGRYFFSRYQIFIPRGLANVPGKSFTCTISTVRKKKISFKKIFVTSAG